MQKTRKQHLAAILIFAGMIVLVFHRAIFFGEILAPMDLLTKELPWKAVLPGEVRIDNFTQADVLTIFEPWRHFMHEELQAGRFPLWCSNVGCGYPVAGQGMINLFGLTTICLWAWPPRVAMVVAYSTQIFVAMLGMYVLLCSLRLQWRAAVFGALVFGLNSRLFQDLELNCTTGALVMLPWMGWALWRGVEGETKWFALAGLFYGWGILNGSLQTHVIVWLSAAGFVTTAFGLRDRQHFAPRSLRAIAMFSVTGWLIGAVALWPNLELMAFNERARFERINWFALMLHRPVAIGPWLMALLNPDAIGNSQTFDLVRGLGQFGHGATTPTMDDLRQYCGLSAVALAVLGLRTRGPVRALGVVLIVLPAVVGFITPLYLLLYFRSLALVPCGIAMLAALGFERLLNADGHLGRDTRRVVAGLAAAAVFALAMGALVSAKRTELQDRVEQAGASKTSLYKADVEWQRQKARATVGNFSLSGPAVLRFCVLAGVVGGLLLGAPRAPAAVTGLLLMLNTGDLTEFAWRTFSSVPVAFHYPATPALEFLRAQPGMFRVASSWDRQAEPPTGRQNMLLVHGLDDPRVYDAFIPSNPLLQRQDWDALNVKYFMTPPGSAAPDGEWRRVFSEEVDIYENPNVVPRVSLEGGQISVVTYVSGRIVLAVETPRAGQVVVRERVYPGWRAHVNGRRVPLKTSEEMWQSAMVPAGQSRVEFRYCPLSVYGGAGLTGGGLLLALGLWWRGRRTG